jgi:hypothetical protein
VVAQGHSDAFLQGILRDWLVQLKSKGPIGFVRKGVAVNFPDRGYEFAGTLEVHGVVIGGPGLPVDAEGTSLLDQVAGLPPFQAFLHFLNVIELIGHFHNQLPEIREFFASDLRIGSKFGGYVRVLVQGEHTAMAVLVEKLEAERMELPPWLDGK